MTSTGSPLTAPVATRVPVAVRDVAVRRARSAANHRIAWYGHGIVYGLSVSLLWFLAGFTPAVVLALSWGVALALHGFFGVVAPRLRERFIDEDLRRATPGLRAEESAEARRRAQSLGELSAAIAHEIRNPITAAKSLVQQIAEDPGGTDTVEHARVAVEELDRVERSIAHLLRYAREEPFSPRETTTAELVDSAVALMVDRAEQARAQLIRDVDVASSLVVNPEQIRAVLGNLIGNALDALGEHATSDPRVTVSAGENLAGTETWFSVRDNGPGIPRDAREKIFRPFYTSKARGTGLGLALARKIAERHGGTLTVTEREGPGAELVLVLPRRGAGQPS